MNRINRYVLTLTSAALMCGTAVAQQRTTQDPTAQYRPLKAGEVQASHLIGAPVKNSSGATIGEVQDLVVGSGDINLAVVSVGGFLGVGEKNIAISYDELSVSPDGNTLYVQMTEQQLKDKPAFDPDGDKAEASKSAAAARARTESAPRAAADQGSREVAGRTASSAQSSASDGKSGAARTLKATEQAASSIIGAPLLDSQNERVGRVHDLIVGERQATDAVLAIGGGVAGLGAHMVTVPLSQLTVKHDPNESERRNADSVHTMLTVAQLEALPEFRYR